MSHSNHILNIQIDTKSHSIHMLSIQIDTKTLELALRHSSTTSNCPFFIMHVRLLHDVRLLDTRKYAKKVGKQAEKGTEAKYQICIILHLNINLL